MTTSGQRHLFHPWSEGTDMNRCGHYLRSPQVSQEHRQVSKQHNLLDECNNGSVYRILSILIKG